jgi:hypothetical protein
MALALSKAARGASERPEDSSPSMQGRICMASSQLSRAEASSSDVVGRMTKPGRSDSSSGDCARRQCISISGISLGTRPHAQVSAAARQALGEDFLDAVARRCRELYRDGQTKWLLRTASSSRRIVALKIEPFVNDVNATLRASRRSYYFTVESEYASRFSTHPRYYLAVRHV